MNLFTHRIWRLAWARGLTSNCYITGNVAWHRPVKGLPLFWATKI